MRNLGLSVDLGRARPMPKHHKTHSQLAIEFIHLLT
jgi:hypothetical protein